MKTKKYLKPPPSCFSTERYRKVGENNPPKPAPPPFGSPAWGRWLVPSRRIYCQKFQGRISVKKTPVSLFAKKRCPNRFQKTQKFHIITTYTNNPIGCSMVFQFESLSWKLRFAASLRNLKGSGSAMESYRMKSGYKAVRIDSDDEDDPMGLGLLSSIVYISVTPVDSDLVGYSCLAILSCAWARILENCSFFHKWYEFSPFHVPG